MTPQERDFEAERLFDPGEWSDFFAYAARIHEAATKHAVALVPSVSFDTRKHQYNVTACVKAAPSGRVRA